MLIDRLTLWESFSVLVLMYYLKKISGYFGPSSLPVTIPSSSQRNQLGSVSQSPLSSPLSSLPNSLLPSHLQQQKQEQQLQEVGAMFGDNLCLEVNRSRLCVFFLWDE